MSYIVLFFLIIGGYVLGAPILRDSLQFRLVNCIPGENETLSKLVLEITNVNQTCIRVNKSSPLGDEITFQIVPQTENGVQLHITTQDCSTPLPALHLSLCDGDDDESNGNSSEIMVTFGFDSGETIDGLDDDYNNTNITSTIDTFLSTAPTVYETLHHLDGDSDEEENNITNAPSVNGTLVNEESDKSPESNED